MPFCFQMRTSSHNRKEAPNLGWDRNGHPKPWSKRLKWATTGPGPTVVPWHMEEIGTSFILKEVRIQCPAQREIWTRPRNEFWSVECIASTNHSSKWWGFQHPQACNSLPSQKCLAALHLALVEDLTSVFVWRDTDWGVKSNFIWELICRSPLGVSGSF